jgi:hypothetical protein
MTDALAATSLGGKTLPKIVFREAVVGRMSQCDTVMRDRLVSRLPRVQERKVVLVLAVPGVGSRPQDRERLLQVIGCITSFFPSLRGFSRQARFGQVIYELALNIGLHSFGGVLMASRINVQGRYATELCALDCGPGVENLEALCVRSARARILSRLSGRGMIGLTQLPDLVEMESPWGKWEGGMGKGVRAVPGSSLNRGTYYRAVWFTPAHWYDGIVNIVNWLKGAFQFYSFIAG